MKARLERAGQRSISALVDISNYVLLELGRPTHVFDLDRIHGGLTVRWARQGEALELLNGQTVSLDPEVGVIEADGVPESRSEEHTSELQSLMRSSYAVFCWKKN